MTGSRCRVFAAAVAFIACAPEPAGAEAPSAGPIVERNVAVPMRDEVILRADIYRPPGAGPFPLLIYRTPYGKQAAAESYETHRLAVSRGYAVMLQDVRGRYASDGVFNPYRNEGRDGYDTIEWAAGQSWSDGRIGTFGLSYPGAAQWLTAMERPPHLKAMVPAMTYSSPRHFFYTNGLFDLSWLPWIYRHIAPDRRRRLELPGITDSGTARSTWPEVAADYQSHRPLIELPWLRRAAPFYFEWLQHPPEDPWWDWAELRGRYDRVDAAVLNLSGWYDDPYGPEGAVSNFRGLRATRGDDARTQLVLGPWTHGVGATMSDSAGDLQFGPSAAIDYDAVVLDFFDRYLRQTNSDVTPDPPVRYFVMGENRWRTARTWPPGNATTEELHLQLSADGRGRLAFRPAPGNGRSSSTFPSDPKAPVTDPYDTSGAHDYRALATRADVLTFDTEPLADDLTVAGPVTAVVHAACDCRDFDLWVRIQDVYPDGRAMNIMSPGRDVVRASYRNYPAAPQPVVPGYVYELRLSDMHTGISFARGHRLRVQISGSFAPHYAANLQTGESEIRSARSEAAEITVHHDRDRPSRLLLPVTH